MQIEVISGGKRLTMWVLAAAQYGWHYRHDNNSLYSYIEGLAELKNAFKSCPFTSKILEQCLSRRQRTIEEKDIFWGLPHQKWCSTEIRVRVSLSQAWNNFKLLETIKSVQIALAQSSPPDKFLRPSKRWAPRTCQLAWWTAASDVWTSNVSCRFDMDMDCVQNAAPKWFPEGFKMYVIISCCQDRGNSCLIPASIPSRRFHSAVQ